jgi:diguanylate cyclase (GGDEF)-like protein
VESGCKQAGRARSGPPTFWDLGLEIHRAIDGQALLVEPPAEGLRAVGVDLDCKTGRLIRRKSMDELITDSVGLVLALFPPAEDTPTKPPISCIVFPIPASADREREQRPAGRGNQGVPEFMDPASGVFGEEAFQQLLTREASRATRYQDFFSVCLVRPDGTDHEPDEAMQQAVARKIAQVLRSTDVVARLRDGIAILLLNTPDPDAARVAERIRAHLENVSFQPDPAGPARRVALSMGLVSFPRDGHNETVLLSRAQSRLKEAAERGGNRVVASDGS